MAIPIINMSNSLGLVIGTGSQDVTGSLVVTLLLIMILLFGICLMFKMPIEVSGVIMLPLMIVSSSYYNNLLAPLIAFLLYFAVIIAKYWLFR